MSTYRIFNADDAVAYAKTYGHYAHPEQLLQADEIGDGNLNLVFKIRDAQGISRLIVKQALPYVRCVGESWPLTTDRARLEAETLLAHHRHSPEHTVRIIHYDPELAVMVQEDLSDHFIWRNQLIQGIEYPGTGQRLGSYLATVHFYTSDFYLSGREKKAQAQRFSNPEMCQITEDLFFTDPYTYHELNRYDAALAPLVDRLSANAPLRTAVAALKHQFLSHAEALLHGDIHSGSIFVAPNRLKAIDAEFGFFGPAGFDLGTAIGNLLLNHCAAPGLFTPEVAQNQQHARRTDIHELWTHYHTCFSQLVAQHANDPALAVSGYAEQFLQKVWRDSLGYAGTELIRRTIGMAPVADLLSIRDEQQRWAAESQALHLGHSLIVQAADSQHPLHHGCDALFTLLNVLPEYAAVSA